ncbi:hypothetical protein ASE01_01275 [Nocardioides sp. Root190]|uniref:S1 family peptidase n=1 Tax=Nocardioides sp. Root190 TaxID=1736488 RepID=UPI0006FFC725|nr:serine protease [Nocardioides sp. Root190]KRB80159.1 hypothetical protein ASE01_01275 [Nocardioides sp. Root190]
MLVSIRGALAALGATVALTSFASPALADETPTGSDDTSRVVALTQPGVVYETIEFTTRVWSDYNQEFISDEPITVPFTCTGFVVNPDGWIATAGHCVDTEQEEVVAALYDTAVAWALENYYSEGVTAEEALDDLYIDEEVQREVFVTLPAAVTGDELEKELPARVIDATTFDEGDAALLKVEAEGLNGLPLAEDDPEIGADITSVGYPAIIEGYTDHDLVPTFQPGTISSSKTVGSGLLPVYQLSQDLQGGMSGGPTVNSDGEVIGVISAGFDTTDVSYASPIGRIVELLSAAGVDPELSETATAFRDGVMALGDGERAEAISQLEKVIAEQPRNQSAADQLERAEALPVEESSGEESSADSAINWTVAAIAGGTAVLLGLIIATAVAVARRRSRAALRHQGTAVWPPTSPAPTQAWATGPAQQWAPQQGPPVAQPIAQPVGFTPSGPTVQEQQPPYGWR